MFAVARFLSYSLSLCRSPQSNHSPHSTFCPRCVSAQHCHCVALHTFKKIELLRRQLPGIYFYIALYYVIQHYIHYQILYLSLFIHSIHIRFSVRMYRDIFGIGLWVMVINVAANKTFIHI